MFFMNNLTQKTQEITSSIKPFIDAITEDQREAVLNVLAVTLERNLPVDVIANNSEFFEILKINADVLASVADSSGNEPVATTETGDFASDLELFALYSKISSESVMSKKSEANKVAQAIVNSGNQSLLFAASKSPFAEKYAFNFAKKLAEIGEADYLYRAFASIEKNTPRSRKIAEALAATRDANLIYEALTNEDVENGKKESLTLAQGLASTKEYDLIFKAYGAYENGTQESLVLCEALASSGDSNLIQKVMGDTPGEEELKILACGLQAAIVYTQIKKALL